MQEIARHELDFEGFHSTGLGYQGEIVLAESHSRHFFLFKYEGNKYTASMKRDLPDGLRDRCDKSVNSRGELFFQQGKDKDTLCCNSDGKVITRRQHKGRLLDSVGNLLMYARGTFAENDWSIEVHECTERGSYHSGRAASERQVSQPVLILKPPAPHGWRGGLSVCSVQDRYVVVDTDNSSLDTFDSNGKKWMCLSLLLHLAQTYHIQT